jgi:hypothetical protein
MSNKKKPKKLRTPNVMAQTAATATVAAPAETRRAGLEPASPSRLGRATPAPAAATSNFDYTYVKKDLSRIGVLAGSFIVALVILSFFIH